MRPPEALLDAPQSISADIWTLGCVVGFCILKRCIHVNDVPQFYELITGESLFDPVFQTVELGLTPEESHLIQIIELLGQFPRDTVKAGKNGRKWFQEDGMWPVD